jgi:NADH-quinone oxidoreductase subunit H
MDNFILYLIAFLIFPGFLFTSIFGLLVSWVDRKVSALIQWRVGPPLFQPFFDLFKLWHKELLIPTTARKTGFMIAPFIGLSATTLLATILGIINLNPEVRFIGDTIVIIYLMIIPPLAIIWGGFSSGNPMGVLGSSREIKLMMAYELPFILAIVTVFFKVGSISLGEIIEYQGVHGIMLNYPSMVIAFIVSILCLQAKLAQVPFDISEAECEIMEGPFIEYSGPLLGIFKTTQAMLHVVVPWFLISIFWGGTSFEGWGILWSFLKFIFIITLVILIKNTNPRVRIDQALKFFWGWVTLLALIAMVLMFLGY